MNASHFYLESCDEGNKRAVPKDGPGMERMKIYELDAEVSFSHHIVGF